MNRKVEKGKTLLVDGPASVTVKSGVAEVFGFHINNSQRIVIREGKRLPFAVEDTVDFEIALGVGGAAEVVNWNTVPVSWAEAFGLINCAYTGLFTIMVIGGVDSGKTSFCTYLTNRLVSFNYIVAVLDEDLGQSDIGPPCTIAYAYVSKPVTDLFNVYTHNAVFVGATSPAGVMERAIEALTLLQDEIAHEGKAHYLVVNTDGWAEGEEAVQFKSRLASVLKPDIILCLQGGELPSYCEPFAAALQSYRQIKVESSISAQPRNREHRRKLRELGYVRYLHNARVRVYHTNHLRVVGIEFSFLFRNQQAENLLVGLYSNRKRFLGIGVIRGVDNARKALKVLTSVEQKPSVILFGKVRLDKQLHEISQSY